MGTGCGKRQQLHLDTEQSQNGVEDLKITGGKTLIKFIGRCRLCITVGLHLQHDSCPCALTGEPASTLSVLSRVHSKVTHSTWPQGISRWVAPAASYRAAPVKHRPCFGGWVCKRTAVALLLPHRTTLAWLSPEPIISNMWRWQLL